MGEEFAGPVMLEGVGSAQFIAETLVPIMQARRPPDTENPRMAMQTAQNPFLNRTGLRVMADAFAAKYGSDWAFEVADDGTFRGPGASLVYQLTPAQALGFGKDPFSHTRWDFDT